MVSVLNAKPYALIFTFYIDLLDLVVQLFFQHDTQASSDLAPL